MSRRHRLLGTLFAAALAFVPGCIGSAVVFSIVKLPAKVEYVPLPHHVPKSANAASFRFAMAHDVIHERFPKHGPAFYRERERLARTQLPRIAADSAEAFGLYDDIGAGLDRLGKPADAVPLLRHKLELQQQRGLTGRDLYTTYANLGTFLVHANMPKAIAGDLQAKAAVREGLDLVGKSVDVNPEAHFGRETWQIVLGEFLLAAGDDPKLLTQFDFVGNQIDRSWKELRERPTEEFAIQRTDDFGRASRFGASPLVASTFIYDWNQIDRDPNRLPEVWDSVKHVREEITTIGAEEGWPNVAVPTHRKPVPFDEPLLGIIGMWRQGGGANPHFALCIGEIMLRVGQRRIAWTAYERAKGLAERFWPQPNLQQALRDHCDRRQHEIEQTLPPGEVANLRPTFDDELAYGLRYQREYQEYEAAKMATGADIADEHLFDAFHAGREPIASPTGPEEWYAYQRPAEGLRILGMFGGGVFVAGLVAFVTALGLNRWAKP